MVNSITNPSITVRGKLLSGLLIFIGLFFLPNLCFAQDVVVKKRFVKPKTHIYQNFKFGVSLWGENVPLQTADGRSENIDVKYSGFSMGYEPSYKWINFAVWANAQALLLQGQAVSEGSSIIYQNKVKYSIPFLTDFGVSYYPHQNVSLGLGAGLLFHSLKLDPPTSVLTTYDFKYSDPLKIIYTFKLSWLMSKSWSLEQKIMTFAESNIDTGWDISLNYLY